MSPVGSTRDAVAVRTLITGSEPSLRSAIAAAVRSRTPVSAVVDGLLFVCFRLSGGGVVVLARRVDADSADECREDLESIGPWLTGAVDASLAAERGECGSTNGVLSPDLREATSRGSLRQVVGAFIEAVSVWDDVRVRIFVGGASGGFLEYASSMATHSSLSADPLDDTVVPRQGQLARLTRADVDRAGLVIDPGDTVIGRLVIGAGTTWVLVFSGMINDAVQVRLRVYADILRESLNEVLTTSSSRIMAELTRHRRR